MGATPLVSEGNPRSSRFQLKSLADLRRTAIAPRGCEHRRHDAGVSGKVRFRAAPPNGLKSYHEYRGICLDHRTRERHAPLALPAALRCSGGRAGATPSDLHGAADSVQC